MFHQGKYRLRYLKVSSCRTSFTVAVIIMSNLKSKCCCGKMQGNLRQFLRCNFRHQLCILILCKYTVKTYLQLVFNYCHFLPSCFPGISHNVQIDALVVTNGVEELVDLTTQTDVITSKFECECTDWASYPQRSCIYTLSRTIVTSCINFWCINDAFCHIYPSTRWVRSRSFSRWDNV